MAAGVSAVISEICAEFGQSNVAQRYVFDTMSTVLRFSAEGRIFLVSVSVEFDQDYGTGQLSVDLAQLGAVLRASRDGRASVTTTGISN